MLKSSHFINNLDLEKQISAPEDE